MMAGIALTACLASSLTISKISLTLTPLACLAFFLLMIGAIARAGSMPFHSWIPDAAIDAPLPFMALLPAALEKLLGIYLLTRIAMDMFKLTTDSWLSLVMMIVGAATIILAVMMALIQRDYKRLLSFHAISQVGYMILGIGTAVPVGIVGGLFHMLNNALYKSCLFLTAGSVEKQTGTTDLGNLGGIASRMPVTFGCFLVTALSISGVPPFNGFFSKELVYDAALQRGFIFYLAAVVGSFFTAASFLKLGHAAYLGRGNGRYNNLKEASWFMLAPMIVIASLCAIFGVFNGLPLKGLIQPVLGERLAGHSYAGMPSDMKLVAVTIFILAAALLNHILSVKITGSALKASDIFHYTPVLSGIYDKAERGRFDPYELGLKLAAAASAVLYRIDRMIDWVYDNFSVGITDYCSGELRKFHSGKYTDYLRWSLLGMLLVALLLLRV
jgi:NADH-quinone oxidoreductase subunit L